MTSAAFFDVDGTLINSTIVHHYVYCRRRRMGRLLRRVWFAFFLLKCIYFLIVDKISRSRLNVVFYRSYRGLPAAEIKAMVDDCYREMMEPRLFVEAKGCIAAHRHAGRKIVLVTGSIDFIMQPVVEAIGVDHLIAPSLVESGGRFTGALDGPPVGEQEKARRMKEFAQANEIDLADSFAYGDSLADVPMLETVGHPQTVNPSKGLAALAVARGWPVHRWTKAP